MQGKIQKLRPYIDSCTGDYSQNVPKSKFTLVEVRIYSSEVKTYPSGVKTYPMCGQNVPMIFV